MASKNPASEEQLKKRNAARGLLRAGGYTIDTLSSVLIAVMRVIGTLLLVLLVTGTLFTCIFAYYVKTCLTPELDISLEDYQLSEASTIWHQDLAGEWQEGITIGGDQRRIWVEYEDIPKYMEQALIAIEDKRFYEHKGVDWYRTAGAFVQMFARMETSYGGSTITQ